MLESCCVDLGGVGQRRGRAFELLRRGRDGFDDAADGLLELIGERHELRLALGVRGLLLKLFLIGFAQCPGDDDALDPVDRGRDFADLVVAA